MKTTLGKCVICGGKTRIRNVELIRKRNGKIYVFEGVPAKVCDSCGEQFFSAEVVDQMDEIIKGHPEGIPIEATRISYPKKVAA